MKTERARKFEPAEFSLRLKLLREWIDCSPQEMAAPARDDDADLPRMGKARAP